MTLPNAPSARNSCALRLTSDRFFEGCVFNGYIVGRDQPVYEDSTEELMEFLDAKL